MIKKISPRARHKTAYWSNITWFEKHQAQGLYIFRDFIEARGGEQIFIEDAVATRFHVPIRSGLVGQTCAHECSKFLVLKSKSEFKM